MRIPVAIKILLAILIGIVAVFTVQLGISKIWNLTGVSWGSENLPYTLQQQIAALITSFMAGTAGPVVAVLIARKKAVAILIAFLAIGLTIDIYAAMGPMKTLPHWFRISWVVGVIIQTALGFNLGGWFLRKYLH